MAYKVAIRNNQTKEVRERTMDLEFHEATEFWWTEGNMSCDCNRGLEFIRANRAVTEEEYDATQCGDEKYSVMWLEHDGKRIDITKEIT